MITLKGNLMAGASHLVPPSQPTVKKQMTGKTGVRRATAIERHKIGALLTQHCESINPGFCRYKEGWSDTVVRNEIGGDLPLASVSHYRAQVFGKLAKEPKPLNPEQAALIEAINFILESYIGSKKRIFTNADGTLTFGEPE